MPAAPRATAPPTTGFRSVAQVPPYIDSQVGGRVGGRAYRAELGLRKREGVGWVGARLARTVLEFCVFFMQSQNRESVFMNCCTGIMNCCTGTRVYIHSTIHRHF